MTFDDLKGFRGIKSKLTGHGESHLNPQGVLLSNGPLGSALPQAQGLALGDKVAKRDRVTICTVSDGASMEGRRRKRSRPSLDSPRRNACNPFVLVLSDNDTKLSGRITRDSYSMQRTFQAMGAGLECHHRQRRSRSPGGLSRNRKGHRASEDQSQFPACLVWVKTIKGYGVKATEENPAGGHGFPLSNGEKIVEFVDEI